MLNVSYKNLYMYWIIMFHLSTLGRCLICPAMQYNSTHFYGMSRSLDAHKTDWTADFHYQCNQILNYESNKLIKSQTTSFSPLWSKQILCNWVCSWEVVTLLQISSRRLSRWYWSWWSPGCNDKWYSISAVVPFSACRKIYLTFSSLYFAMISTKVWILPTTVPH